MRNLHKQAARPLSESIRYIYGLVDPRTNFIRYIGKAKDTKRRYAGHLVPSQLEHHSHHRANWLKELLRLGLKPIMEILETVPTAQWEEAEREWIAMFRNLPGYPDLTNATDGGEGLDGFVASDELRKHRSKLSKGRKMSSEAKAKISAAHKGRVHTEQARANMSKGRKKWWKNLTNKEREKISSTMRSGITEETRKKAGLANRNIPKHKGSVSRYRGVTRIKDAKNVKNPWRAVFTVGRRPIHIGVFSRERDAARARDLFVLKNFPNQNIILNFRISNYSIKEIEGTIIKFGPTQISKSGFRGVYWHNQSNKWNCSADFNGKRVGLGLFPNTDEGKIAAAETYDRWVIQHRSPMAYTNFPRSDYE